MAFELPFPPFPHDSRDVPFIATPDDNNGYAVPSSQYFKKLVGEKYLWTPVSSTDPLPSSDAAAQAKLADILTKLSADPATQTTLAQILAKIIAAPATEAKQTALNALIGEVQAAPTANTLLARLKSLEDKIAAIIAGTSPAVTTLSGSNVLQGKLATVTTAGTRVQLPALACREVTIIAKRTNTGYIYVGGSDVSTTVYGAELASKDSITLQVSNANLIYVNASVSGEGISYVAI